MGWLGVHNHTWAWIIGGFFASLAIAISFYEIFRHIHSDHNKYVRRYIIRILLMVAVYAIESFFGIIYPSASLYLNAIRDIYEAITVYSFYQLLINALGGFMEVSESLQKSNANQEFPHMFPLKYCCKPWKYIQNNNAGFDYIKYEDTLKDSKPEINNASVSRTQSSILSVQIPNAFDYENARSNPFFRNCTIGVLQYCFVQVFSTVIMFILQFCDKYGEGTYAFTVGYPYFVILLTVSQSWAIYCLVLFYYSIKSIHNLEVSVYAKFIQMRAIWKFLCIKGVVFFTYWQSIGIAFLVFINFIHDDMMNSFWTADNIANSLQDFIICIEMFGFAIAHHFAFDPCDFRFENESSFHTPINSEDRTPKGKLKRVGKAVIDAVNVTDIVFNAKDVVDLKNSAAIQVINHKIKMKKMVDES